MRGLDGSLNQCFEAWLSSLLSTDGLNGAIELPEYIRTTNDRNLFREFVFEHRYVLQVL